MVSMDAFAAAFGLASKQGETWFTLGKVTAVNGSKLSVLMGGSATPTQCEAYCIAGVGDVVLIIIKDGAPRAIATKGGVNDAAKWRDALGLGSMALEDSSDYVLKTDTIPINRGGTGQTAAETTSTIANIITQTSEQSAAYPITYAYYAKWGKLAMLRITVKPTAATSVNTNMSIGTVVSGKLPIYTAFIGSGFIMGSVSDDGAVTARPRTALTANSGYIMTATYMLP